MRITADKKILLGIIIGVGIVAGLALIPFASDSAIPPTRAFFNVTDGTGAVSADSYRGTLNLLAGENVTFVFFPANDTIKIDSAGGGSIAFRIIGAENANITANVVNDFMQVVGGNPPIDVLAFGDLLGIYFRAEEILNENVVTTRNDTAEPKFVTTRTDRPAMGSFIGKFSTQAYDDSNSTVSYTSVENVIWNETAGFRSGEMRLSVADTDGASAYIQLNFNDTKSIIMNKGLNLTASASDIDMNNNQLYGSMKCDDQDILQYNFTTDLWECETKPQPYVIKTADETVNNSAVMQNDNDLVLPVDNNRRYWGYVSWIYSSSATADFDYTLTVPAGAVGRFSPNTTPTGTLGTSYGTQANCQGGGVGVIATCRLDFWLLTSGTAGNIQFQWAQQTAEATNTIVYESSMMRIFDGGAT